MIRINNVSLNAEQYKNTINNVSIHGDKNNYWCREISIKKKRN